MTKPFDKMLDAIRLFADANAQVELHKAAPIGNDEYRETQSRLFNERERARRSMLHLLYENFDTSHKGDGMFSDRADVLLAYFDGLLEPTTLGKELVNRLREATHIVDNEVPMPAPADKPQKGERWYASWKFESDASDYLALIDINYLSDQVVDFFDQEGDRQVFRRSRITFIERV